MIKLVLLTILLEVLKILNIDLYKLSESNQNKMLKLLYILKSYVDDIYIYTDRDEKIHELNIFNEIDCFNKLMRLHLSEVNDIEQSIELNQIIVNQG